MGTSQNAEHGTLAGIPENGASVGDLPAKPDQTTDHPPALVAPSAARGSATSHQPLVVLLAAASGGIVCDRYLQPGMATWIGMSLAATGLWWINWQRGVGRLSLSLIIVAVAATAATWHHVRWRVFLSDELGACARFESMPACLEAVVSGSPRLRPAPPPNPLRTIPQGDETSLVLRIERVRDGCCWQSASGRARLTVDGHLLGVRVGDRVRVLALLTAPRPPQNPGEFDFASFERGHRRLCRLHASFPECVTVIEPAGRSGLKAWVNDLRDQGNALLWRNIQHGNAGLAAAILLGAREQVDRQRSEDFLTTGTVHLLAISGLHVGILAYGFWMLARLGPCSRRTTLIIAVGLVILYAALTDARPPVVRASVIIGTACAARFFGRRLLGFNTLALAGIVLLWMNPANLFQTGTQLSFLAVATLGCCSPLFVPRTVAEDPLDRLIAQSRPWPIQITSRCVATFWRLWISSAAIWLVALPLVMYRFHLITPIALFLNPIVCLPISLALFSGFGVLIFGWLVPPLALVCGWVCDANLSAIQWCIRQALLIPGNHVWTPTPPLWWVLGFYAAMGYWAAVPGRRLGVSWRIALTVAWLAIGWACTAGPLARARHATNHRLVCTFIAVGHGTSVLVEMPQGQTLLYDAGCLGEPTAAARAIAGTLWSRGIDRLDAVVISHADVDHYNAIPDLIERFDVGTIFVSPLMFREETRALKMLRDSIEAADVPIRELDTRDRLVADDVVCRVLHPPRRGVRGSDNANSIVLLIEYAGRRLLLPGDLESPGLEDLLDDTPIDCDLVMAPHHGSAHSQPAGFAAWATPQWVVISGGIRRNDADVRSVFMASGAQVVHTADRGAIQFQIGREAVRHIFWKK